MTKKTRFRPTALLKYILLYAIAACVLYPILFMLINSVKDFSEFAANTIGLPTRFNFQSYPNAYMKAKFYYAIPNSLYITVLSVGLLVLLGSMAAYPIARINLKVNKIIFRIFLAGMIVPLHILAVPLFVLLRQAGLINSLTAVAVASVATLLPLTIFIYTGFIKGIPKDLEEAAAVDGYGPVRTFVSIIFPLSRSATVTVVILTSLEIWNSFFYPLVFLSNPDKVTLSLAVFSFKSFEIVKWPDMFAAMSMIVVPVIVLYLLLQKQFVRGMVSGAVKG